MRTPSYMGSASLKSRVLGVAILVLICFAIAGRISAQSVPALINYQGRLTGQTGAPMSAGLYTLQFRLWDDPLTTATNDLIWAQQQTVAVQTNGVFDVILGSSVGIPISGLIPLANSLSLAFTQTNRYLGVTVTSSNSVSVPNASEILPRQQLLSAPYAISAGTALTAINAINGVPAGTVVQYAGIAAPSGFLLCDGSSYSSAVYSNLFAAIGTNWGVSNGTNNFTVPDFRGRISLGAGVGNVDSNNIPLTARILAQHGGEEIHQLTVAEMPAHVHGVTYVPAHWGSSTDGYINNNALSAQGTYNTEPTGGNQPHNIMPPFAVVNYIIKY